MCTENANNNTTDNKYVLAMYDIRAKQEFIYRSTHMKEIVGASWLIRDCYADFLRPAAEEVGNEEGKKGIYGLRKPEEKESPEQDSFKKEGFQAHLKEYIGEVVYDGGGNFFVMYQDVDTYRKVNKIFYRKVLEGTGTMRVLSSYIEGVHFEDYNGDRDELYRRHRAREQEESILHPVNTLPFVQVDYQSSQPLVAKYQQSYENEPKKVSLEALKKLEKYKKVKDSSKWDKEIEGAKVLDELIYKKGEDSHLAVIYIDGNGMGNQVEHCTNGKKSYEECIEALRKFSKEIQTHYIDERIKEINDKLEGKEKRRFVVYAGDEITFVCQAKEAYKIAKMYLKNLAGELDENQNAQEEKLSKESKQDTQEPFRTSCAGIALFHSHAPYAEAYRIAEECCESGKKWMKQRNIHNASLLDFHYCQGAIGVSLEQIREKEETKENSRPWVIVKGDDLKDSTYVFQYKDDGNQLFCATSDGVEAMAKEFEKIGRSNLKGLAFSAKEGGAEFKKEVKRIKAHQDLKNATEKDVEKIDLSLGGKLSENEQGKLIYDMMTVYDHWSESFKSKKG